MKILLTIIITFGLAHGGQEGVKKKGNKGSRFFKDKTDIPSPLSLRDPLKNLARDRRAARQF